MRITDQDIEEAVQEWTDDLADHSRQYINYPQAQRALDNLLFLEKQLQAKGFTFHQIQEVHARATYRVYQMGLTVRLAYDQEPKHA